MSKANLRIALAQMSMSDIVEENYNKSVNYIKDAAQQGVNLILFPELQFTKFFPQYPKLDVKKIAMNINDLKIKNIRSLCKDLGIFAAPNFYLEESNKYYDATIIINNHGEIINISKMVHIASAEYFYEQDYYEPSNDGFKIFNINNIKIGVIICYDRHIAESFRKCALDGADLIIIPTANTLAENMNIFEQEMRVSAYQNNVFIAMCNRVGIEDKMSFAGESLICSAEGEVVFKMRAKESLGVFDIDFSDLQKIRDRKPFLSLLKKEFY